jgi:RNA polymerase sigma-70 factor, ECF subfamily
MIPAKPASKRDRPGAELEDVHEANAFLPTMLRQERPREPRRKREIEGKVDPVLFTSTILDREDTAWAELALLVKRAQRGDRDAFGSLVEQFQPTVYAIALRRLGNASDALELTQDVFLHVLERITQLREPERFAGWLRQVAVRMAINRATRRVAPPSVETGILEGASMQSDEPLDQLIDRERAERVGAALAKLKSLDREALDAFYIRGHSLIEIAEMLDVPLGTVKRRLHTARKRLKVELESSVADPDEWTSSGNCRDCEDELELVGAGASDRSAW